MNPMKFYVNDEIQTISELLQIAIDRELTMSQQMDKNKWDVEYVEDIDHELSTEEIYIDDFEEFLEIYVEKLVDHFNVDINIDDFRILKNLELTDNQIRVLGRKYLNRRLDSQERTVLSRIRRKYEKALKMIKIGHFLSTDQ